MANTKKAGGNNDITIDDVEGKYKKFYQGTITNSATAISKKTKPTKKTETSVTYDLAGKTEGSVILTNPAENELSLASSQLMDVITIYLTEKLPHNASDESLTKFLDCKLPVETYMMSRGLSDKNQAVKEMKKDLETLFNMRMVAETKRMAPRKNRTTGEVTFRKVTEKMAIRVIDAKPDGEIRDYAHFHIALSFARYLVHSQIMAYPLPILLTAKNKNIYYIGKKLAEHYNINQFKAKRKTDKNYISISALLEYTPEIPTFEEEQSRGRHYRQKCIEPLEKTLDALMELGVVSKWHFTNAKKKPLSEDDLTKYSVSFDEWKERLLYFELKDYPNLKLKNQLQKEDTQPMLDFFELKNEG